MTKANSKAKTPAETLDNIAEDMTDVIEAMFAIALDPNADARARVDAARLVLDVLQEVRARAESKLDVLDLIQR
ncbi:MAG: hypothetical protein AB7T19_20730 [Planctomycetota bacterium]